MTTSKEARALVDKLNAISKRNEYRAYKDKDEDGPGFVLEARPKAGGNWHFVGWVEDVREPRPSDFICYGETLQ